MRSSVRRDRRRHQTPTGVPVALPDLADDETVPAEPLIRVVDETRDFPDQPRRRGTYDAEESGRDRVVSAGVPA